MKTFYSADARKYLALFCWFYGYTPQQFRALKPAEFESLRDFMLAKCKADGYELEDVIAFD